MSTYNGERFLAAQIQSLIDQSYDRWKLLVRDDGSSDRTCELLAGFAAEDPRIQILDAHNNLGAADSFLSLVAAAGDADYYAFCDQDDVWDTDKLLRSRDAIVDYARRPALYCSGVLRVDDNLNPLGSTRACARGPSFANALLQNIAIGCSILVNRTAFKLIRSRLPEPGHIFMHDWWCYQLVAASGHVVYDPRPSLAYRQHAANAVGERAGLHFWLNRYRLFRKHLGDNRRTAHLCEFERCWGGALSAANRELLSRFMELLTEKRLLRRFALLLKTPVQRQTGLDSLLCRVLLLLGYYR